MEFITKYVLIKEVVAPFLIIIISFLIYNILKTIINRATRLKKRTSKKEKTIINLLNNILKYLIIVIVILLILNVYGVDTRALLASLGVVGLVVGLALQDLIKDFIAGIFIIFDNQYGIGDTVTIGGFRGEVIFLGLKSTKMKSVSGEVKIVSNRNITEVINHSLENSLAIVDVPIYKDLDLEKVNSIILEELEKLNKQIEGLAGEIKLLGINSISPQIVRYRVIAETKPLENFRVQREIMFALSKVLSEYKVK